MIYISHTTDAQVVTVPNTWGRDVSGVASFSIRLYSGTERREAATIEATNEDREWRTAVQLRFSLEALVPVGEYTYEITTDAGDLLSRGLARVGQYTSPITPAVSGGITFRQYGG